MLSVYGDDSADETQQRVFAVAGLIGTEHDWNDIKQKWNGRTGGITFHAKNCDSDFGDFANNPHKENKALYRDLTLILADSGIGGYAVA